MGVAFSSGGAIRGREHGMLSGALRLRQLSEKLTPASMCKPAHFFLATLATRKPMFTIGIFDGQL